MSTSNKQIVVNMVNKHLGCLFPYTGEYIVDCLQRRNIEISEKNKDTVLEVSTKLFNSLMKGTGWK